MKPRTFKTESAMLAFVTARPAGAYQLLVLHDDGCSPDRCSCKPDYEVRELTVDNVTEGRRLETEWRKANAS